MKEAFCYKCGKPGSWPLCKECKPKDEPRPEKPVKKKKERFEHHQDYFEAILQVRTAHGPSEDDVWDVIYELQDEKEFDAWKKEEDIHFTDIRAARSVAKTLEKKFNLKVVQTRKDVGFDRLKSKKQYKWTLCLRNRD